MVQPLGKIVWRFLKKTKIGFPGGPMVKNSPCNAGDTSMSSGPGKIPHAVEQLSPCATTIESAL